MAIATAQAWTTASAHRDDAIASVVRREKLLEPKVERARLDWVLDKHVLTDNVKHNGLGSIDVLPEIVEAVGGKARIIVDGGISRGTDVVKAMILGADAVAVGRLYVYGLAAAGAPGIVRLLEILEHEITICLALLGVTGFSGLDKSYIAPARPVTPPHVHSAFPLLDLPRETY